MIELEKTEILERVIPPLAKLFKSTKERAWKILNNNNSLDGPLLNLGNAGFRHQVNEWWKQYRSMFSASLGICSKVSSPSKLPRLTYEQIMCLTWLTDQLKTEQFIQRQKERYVREEKPKFTFWQELTGFIKKFFRKGG